MTRILSLVVLFLFCAAADCSAEFSRDKTRELYDSGNFNDALNELMPHLTSGKKGTGVQGSDLQIATECLTRLNRIDEFDQLVEDAVKNNPDNRSLIHEAAKRYAAVIHYGYMLSGSFKRGYPRGGNVKIVSSAARDRIRSLQLYKKAIDLSPANDPATADLYYEFADAIQQGTPAWRLQYKSDLTELPDYDEQEYAPYGFRGEYYADPSSGAPVDKDGTPVYYRLRGSFEQAENDGERWRWALAQAAVVNPGKKEQSSLKFGEFLLANFGVRTLAEDAHIFARLGDAENRNESGTYALHLLSDEETIARLATGIKKFRMPDEFNYIKIFESIDKKPLQAKALRLLAENYADRRQYPKAAKYWRKLIEVSGENDARHRLDQITGAWGTFEAAGSQAAGTEAVLEYRFRNGTSVHLEAWELKVDKLLENVKTYLKSNPHSLKWEESTINNIGFRIVTGNQTQYLGEKAASWTEQLNPRPHHFDSRVTIKAPLSKSGAYLIKATIAGGNTTNIVVWLNEAVIVQKPLDGQVYYFIADAKSGKPLPETKLSFFGYATEYLNKRTPLGRTHDIKTAEFEASSDSGGELVLDNDRVTGNMQWLTIAKKDDKILGYLGFSGIWYGGHTNDHLNRPKAFIVTDRPVYRPGQTVKYKAWAGLSNYGQKDRYAYAGLNVPFQITNPRGDKILEKNYTTDQYSAFDGEIEIPKDAPLGQYHILVQGPAGGNAVFRVEEYKKPEFEVKIDAPSDPLLLGEKFRVKVKADYYFGAPVQNAKAKIKITRTNHTAKWYPAGTWDWLYGNGYWWFSYNYSWFSGWNLWGCIRPPPFWWPQTFVKPELVSSQELKTGEDGSIEVEIDTAIAKALHGDTDHRYDISVEVTDQSRRTITGNGEVLVARQPFKVYAWTNRGYYRSGETVQASFSARTLNGKPVAGTGKLELFAISYKDGEPVEKTVQSMSLNPDQDGSASQKFTAAAPGQYRISYKVENSGNTVEGGYLFTVTGDGFKSADFRFNNIELIPDRKEYAPGEKVKLLVNTGQSDSTVLLFIKPEGSYARPRLLRIAGKSQSTDIPVEKGDMPNFFIEALTISDGRLHSEIREIYVPPQERILNVTVQSKKESYKPGEEAELKIKILEADGKPFTGPAAISVFDRSLEYIDAGSREDIKSFFWKWRRSHYPRTESNQDDVSYPLTAMTEKTMEFLGAFGATVADEIDDGALKKKAPAREALKELKLAPGAPDMMTARSLPASAPMMAEASAVSDAAGSAPPQEAGANAEAQIRKDFADSVYWNPAVFTDKNGEAVLRFKNAENLTAWKVKSWAMGAGTTVGESTTGFTTSKNLLLRLQAPRFFVEKDEAVLSANIHNYLSGTAAVTAKLEVEGDLLTVLDPVSQEITVESNSEKRVDWRVKVNSEGTAVIRMLALSREESDAMQVTLPVYVHGILKTDSYTGSLRDDEKGKTISLNVPAERRPEQSLLEIRYSPTLAGAMVDALPYLVSFPYGCTEQTLSRFLPTVIVQRILQDMGLDLKAIKEKRANLNAQEIGDPAERAKGWKRYPHNPVFDNQEVQQMAVAGLERIKAMQLSDGGWGWFSGWGEYSSPHTTAYVVHSLQIAALNGLQFDQSMLSRGLDWLTHYQAGEIQKIKNYRDKINPYKTKADAQDAFVYMVLSGSGKFNDEMKDFLYRDKNDLPVYGKAMLGIALHNQDDKARTKELITNIEQFLVNDGENETSYLRLDNGGYWWYWYGSEYEAQSYYLKLLSRTDPKGKTAAGLAKYLINNRKHATYWNSTRDTAITIEALAEFLKASGEGKPDMEIEVLLDGKTVKKTKLTADNLFNSDNTVVLKGDEITSGTHKLEFRKDGKGVLYFNAYLTNFSLEDYIPPAGLEIKVSRKYYRLTAETKKDIVSGSRGQALEQDTEKYTRQEIEDLSVLKSGELVEVELEIESKNDYEYLVFEDMKPAGFEPVDVTSGYSKSSPGIYAEFRDEKVAFFAAKLARGKRNISYRMRAEIPGKFSALPARASAMYAPELRANSSEIKIRVED